MKAMKRFFSSSSRNSDTATKCCRNPTCNRSFQPRDHHDQFCSLACFRSYYPRPSRSRAHVSAQFPQEHTPQYYAYYPHAAVTPPYGGHSSSHAVNPLSVSHSAVSPYQDHRRAEDPSAWCDQTPQATYASPKGSSSSRPPPARPSHWTPTGRPPPANPSRSIPVPQPTAASTHPSPSLPAMMECGPSSPIQPLTHHWAGLWDDPERRRLAFAGHTPRVAPIPMFEDFATEMHTRPTRTRRVSSTLTSGGHERHRGLYGRDGNPVLTNRRYGRRDVAADRPDSDWRTASSITLVPSPSPGALAGL
ncbi:hypothetical protein OH77DRAFT_104960 [Trametes cingulata]|nr:hypothetical protein OH77DRAFT_104960 [Trametes cingulata]